MTKLLLKAFIKNHDDVQQPGVRTAYGSLSGIVGILVNVLLFAGKLLAGLLSGSVAIVADAVNNLSDAGSSVVSLLGFRISRRPPDEGHPFGHGRSEYVAGFIVSFIILLLGLELCRSSVDKIIHPEAVAANALTYIVLAASIAIKVWLAAFNRKLGKAIASPTLRATAQDSLNDVVATSAVLAATVLAPITGLNLDGYMGVLVGLFILYSGFATARDTLNPLLGEGPTSDLVKTIGRKLGGYEGVLGHHDLVVHNYGPGRIFASVHVEVDSGVDILVTHDRIDNIERDFSQQMGIALVIHLDPIVTDDTETNRLRQLAVEATKAVDSALTLHDFRAVVGETHTNLIFDVSVPMDCKLQNEEIVRGIQENLRGRGSYNCVITVDRGYQTDYPYN